MSNKRPPSANAEAAVAAALTAQAWHVLARNFQRHGFELDIVAQKGSTIAFIEVKARRTLPCQGRDTEALLPQKKKEALRRGARAFIAMQCADYCAVTLRFDLALVLIDKQGRAQDISYFVNVMPST